MVGVNARKVTLVDEKNHQRYYYELTNNTAEDVFLKDYVLYEATSLTAMGLNEEDCVMYRSGRHKNDMPSVFPLGKCSEAMKDALGGMTETGDKKEGDAGNRCILSDHLTVLGNKEDYVVITFPEGRKQLVETKVYVDENGKFVRLTSGVVIEIRLTPGRCVSTEIIDIQHTKNVEQIVDEFAKEKARKYGSRAGLRPSVFCTWYYYGLTVTYEDVKTNLTKMQERKLPFDVFQVDEGWEITLGEWEPNKKFPKPMKEVAEEIKAAGYRPGIWTSPFVAHATATIWEKHPEWILKDKEGKPCLFPMNDTVYQVFDITNPATWEYFKELFHKLTFDWGYTYHKLDFTRAAVIMDNAVYYDDTITLVEAYYNAVKAIREGMGEDSYFLMCGGIYDPIIGLVDAQRTGSDVLSMWSSNINKDGKTAPYTMKQSMLRYYMNAWWDNDPDALMVRINPTMERNLRLTYGLLNDEEVKTSVINQYMGGGLVCSTEPLDKIQEDRLMNLQRIMPTIPSKCAPMHLMDANHRFPTQVKIELKDRCTNSIIFINWSDKMAEKLQFTLDEFLLPEGTTKKDSFVVADYYGGQYHSGVKVGDRLELGILKPHASTVVKLEKQAGQPIIVQSSGHFSMGSENISMSCVAGQFTFAYNNPFPWRVQYGVLLPGTMCLENGERLVHLTVEGYENYENAWKCDTIKIM